MERTKAIVKALDDMLLHAPVREDCRPRTARRIVAARASHGCRSGRRVEFSEAALLFRRRMNRRGIEVAYERDFFRGTVSVEDDIDMELSCWEEELRERGGYVEFDFEFFIR